MQGDVKSPASLGGFITARDSAKESPGRDKGVAVGDAGWQPAVAEAVGETTGGAENNAVQKTKKKSKRRSMGGNNSVAPEPEVGALLKAGENYV